MNVFPAKKGNLSSKGVFSLLLNLFIQFSDVKFFLIGFLYGGFFFFFFFFFFF